jgi:HKD family nuclease
MLLQIQDPQNKSSFTLHEALIKACANAKSGGGAFAFVTGDGAKLYLEDKSFSTFLKDGYFNLVIGIDEITNLRALDMLGTLSKTKSNLLVQAFSHNLTQSIFHPKFCWFKNKNGGVLVIGSGNLTVSGLRKNWEAFSVIDLSERDIQEVEKTWLEWKENCKEFIKPLSDDGVRQKAKQNIIKRRTKILSEVEEEEVIIEISPEDEHPDDFNVWKVQDTDKVLIREIPKGSTRWNQANFDKDSFENFFGSESWNNSYRILLKQVRDDNNLIEVENRQAVSVKSHNWRFELGAAAGIEYPEKSRPIGIFIKVGLRMFLYTLVMPTSAYYSEVDKYLESKWSGNKRNMRTISLEVAELKIKCPNLPFWKVVNI